MSHKHNKKLSKLHGCDKFLMLYYFSIVPHVPLEGAPLPRVTWFKEHSLIDDSYQELVNGSVRNVLHLPKITRADLESVSCGDVIKCRTRLTALQANPIKDYKLCDLIINSPFFLCASSPVHRPIRVRRAMDTYCHLYRRKLSST